MDPVREVVYLGHVLRNDCSDSSDVLRTRHQIVAAGFQINQAISCASFDQKLRVLESKALHLYGCTTWKFHPNAFSVLEVAWRLILKTSTHLPRRTRTVYLHALTGAKTVTQMVYSRNVKFLANLNNSDKKLIRSLIAHNQYDMRTIIGNNSFQTIKFSGQSSSALNLPQHITEIWDIVNDPQLFVPSFTRDDLLALLHDSIT